MRPVWLLWSIVIASSPAIAMAAEPTAADADRAFQEGMSLFNAGRTAEACSRFAESFRIAPANGTLLNLATCHEKEGKRALAFREWTDLVTRAANAGQKPRETTARQRAAELGARLPFIRLRGVSSTNVESIRLDDDVIDKSGWGEAIALDTGTHTLVLSAAGKVSVTKTFEATEPKLTEIELPALENERAAEPAKPPATAPAVEPVTTSPSRATIGWIAGGAGLALVGVGTYFGIDAIGKRSESDDHCPNGVCTQEGVDRNDEAITSAWIANVCIGVGIAAIAVGAYFVVTGRPTAPKSTALVVRF